MKWCVSFTWLPFPVWVPLPVSLRFFAYCNSQADPCHSAHMETRLGDSKACLLNSLLMGLPLLCFSPPACAKLHFLSDSPTSDYCAGFIRESFLLQCRLGCMTYFYALDVLLLPSNLFFSLSSQRHPSTPLQARFLSHSVPFPPFPRPLRFKRH